MSQGPWPFNCEGPWFSSKACTIDMVCQNLRQTYLLKVGLMRNSGIPWNIIHNVSNGNPCRLFIHEISFGPLRLHLLVWSKPKQSQPFQPMRDVECNGHVPSISCVKWLITMNKHGEPTTGHKWTRWAWEITGWCFQDFRKSTHQSRGIYETYLLLIKKTQETPHITLFKSITMLCGTHNIL